MTFDWTNVDLRNFQMTISNISKTLFKYFLMRMSKKYTVYIHRTEMTHFRQNDFFFKTLQKLIDINIIDFFIRKGYICKYPKNSP